MESLKAVESKSDTDLREQDGTETAEVVAFQGWTAFIKQNVLKTVKSTESEGGTEAGTVKSTESEGGIEGGTVKSTECEGGTVKSMESDGGTAKSMESEGGTVKSMESVGLKVKL